ncbi:MAG: hypothetical protein V4466_10985 [Pseudomonadota bacterium]
MDDARTGFAQGLSDLFGAVTDERCRETVRKLVSELRGAHVEASSW